MSFKETKRKGFNFFRSYYDVFNELPDKDKLAFISALLDRQFLGVKPKDLKDLANFAWISQVNSIDSQVKGFEDKTGIKLTPTEGGSSTPTEQVEGKGEVQVQGKEQEVYKGKPKDIEEVWNYFIEKNIPVIYAEKFFNHYETTGWMRGRNKIKNWKACVKTWDFNKIDNNGQGKSYIDKLNDII